MLANCAFVGVLGSAFVASALGVPLRDCPPRWPAAGAPPLCRCVEHPNHCQRVQPGRWRRKVLSVVRKHGWGGLLWAREDRKNN